MNVPSTLTMMIWEPPSWMHVGLVQVDTGVLKKVFLIKRTMLVPLDIIVISSVILFRVLQELIEIPLEQPIEMIAIVLLLVIMLQVMMHWRFERITL